MIQLFNKYLILLFVGMSFFSCRSGEKPDLEFSVDSYDFGRIKKDSIYQASVIVTNSGKSPLIIKRVDPDCECTSANVSKNTILPEDTCLLTFFYKTFHKESDQENYITIIANTDSVFHVLQINAYVN